MGVDPDDDAAAKVIAKRLSPEKQKWFDNLALRGAHEYAVELEAENAALRDQLAAMERERNEALDQCTELHRRLAQVEKELAEERRLRSELKQIAQIGIEEVSSVGSALQANAVRDATDLAATRMRDLCVAKVREMRSEWAGNEVWIDAADEIITALESLTLDSVQKDQP